MYIVAHEDDSLLFQSPDLLHDIRSGACVSTIYTTAGDDGNNQSYWSGREAGALAGYASMAGVANSWTQSATIAAGHAVTTYQLAAAPRVTQMFLRLPDGRHNGTGFPSDGNESLQRLWTAAINTIHPVDGSTAYTAVGLVNTLSALMSSFAPNDIRVQDYIGRPGGGDHSDHYFTAYFSRAAQQLYTTAHQLVGYQGYDTRDRPANVPAGDDLTAKTNAFYAYGADDPLVCNTDASCAGSLYEAWLRRQYTVGSQAGPTPNAAPTAEAGVDKTVLPGATVQLDGFSGSSDPNGDLLTYHWTQTSGPAITLSSPTAAQPTFSAPDQQTTLGFRLTVNDGQVDSQPSDLVINVVPVDLMMWSAVDAAGPTGLSLSYRRRPGFDLTGVTCDITMAVGTSIPPVNGSVVHTGCADPSGQTVIGSLAPNTRYTFAIRTHYADGLVSAPDVRTAMTRSVAGYVTDNNRATHAWRESAMPGSGVGAAALAVAPSGVANGLFVRTSSATSSWVYYATRRPGAGWSSAVRLGWAGPARDRPLFLSLGPKGRLVAAWTVSSAHGDYVVFRVRPSGTARWGSTRQIATGSALVGLAQDNRGGLHLLTSARHLLTYRTNVTGSWTAQNVPKARPYSTLSGAIAFDPVTNRVTVAYSDASPTGTTVVRVGSAAANVRGVGTYYRRASFTTPTTGTQLSVAAVTGVTSYGGRITVGVRRAGATRAAGSYVMTGTAAYNVGGLTRIAGTTALDGSPWMSPQLAAYGGPVVAAVSATRVVIAFTRLSPTWQSRGQGVFVLTRVYNPTTHRWTFTGASQTSASPYDRPVSIARDRSGHLYIAYFRSAHEL
jgi:hypothetical protein